jgi:hypothetical protein
MEKVFFKIIPLVLSLVFVFNLKTTLASPGIDLGISSTGSGALIKGKTIEVTNPEKYNLKLDFDVSNSFNSPTPVATTPKDTLGQSGLFDAKIEGLTVGKSYYIRAVLTPKVAGDGLTPIETRGTYIHRDAASPTIKDVKKSFFDKDYKLLAPFAGLTVIKSPAECAKYIKNNPSAVCDINTLISFIFRVLVGLTAVAMVIRLMLVGYNYMTTDTPFQKASAKSDLMASLAGLVLALSAWLILNTINPKLIENSFTVSGVSVSGTQDNVESEDVQGSINGIYSGAVPQKAIGKCSAFTEITSNGQRFVVCASVASKLKTLIDDSWTAGIRLSGGGFRTEDQQVALRKLNCPGKDPYKADWQKDCEPDTANPGYSPHEQGLAFDLTCDPDNKAGTAYAVDFINPAKRPWTKKCLDWLTNNSAKYNLKNYAPEPWHWSFN